jgi:uncharacterized LabA/DUF88 family protein
MERVYVAVDVANLWKSCKEAYGERARVDFQTLAGMMESIRSPKAIDQRLVAYTVTNPRQRHHGFAQALTGFGYEVRQRFLRFEKGLATPFATDWDVGITIDACSSKDTFDTFVLVSGDGDFSLLLEHLKAHGKKTVVLTFEHATSKMLYDTADQMYYFNRDVVYMTPAQERAA